MSLETLPIIVNTRIGPFEITLERSKNPVLVERIEKLVALRTLRVEVIFSNLGTYAVLQVSISSPPAREEKTFIPGDVAYDPIHRALVIFLENAKARFIPLGKVTNNMEIIEKVPSPSFVTLEIKGGPPKTTEVPSH